MVANAGQQGAGAGALAAACGRLIGGVVLSTRAVCLSVHLQKRKELLDQWREHDTEIKLLQEEKNMQHAILEKYREQVGAGAAWAAQQGMAEGTAPAWVRGGSHGGFCAAACLRESCLNPRLWLRWHPCLRCWLPPVSAAFHFCPAAVPLSSALRLMLLLRRRARWMRRWTT